MERVQSSAETGRKSNPDTEFHPHAKRFPHLITMAVRPRLVSTDTWARRLKEEESAATNLSGSKDQVDAAGGTAHFGPNVWQEDRGRWSCGPQGVARALSLEEAQKVLEVNKDGLTIVLTANGITVKNCQEVARKLKSPVLDYPGVPCIGLPRDIKEGPRATGKGTLNAYFIKKGKVVQSISDPSVKDFHSELTRQYGERQLAALLGLSEVPGRGALSRGATDSKAEQAVLANVVLEVLSGLPEGTPRWQVNDILTNRIAEVREREEEAVRPMDIR